MVAVDTFRLSQSVWLKYSKLVINYCLKSCSQSHGLIELASLPKPANRDYSAPDSVIEWTGFACKWGAAGTWDFYQLYINVTDSLLSFERRAKSLFTPSYYPPYKQHESNDYILLTCYNTSMNMIRTNVKILIPLAAKARCS